MKDCPQSESLMPRLILGTHKLCRPSIVGKMGTWPQCSFPVGFNLVPGYPETREHVGIDIDWVECYNLVEEWSIGINFSISIC